MKRVRKGDLQEPIYTHNLNVRSETCSFVIGYKTTFIFTLFIKQGSMLLLLIFECRISTLNQCVNVKNIYIS